MPILQAEAVRKVYDSGAHQVEALAGIDLEVEAGELVAVMGPSGCGKTTLLNCLSGLDSLTAGRVIVGGRDLFEMSDNERSSLRAGQMGFVFQAFNLIPVLTAGENVEMPLLLSGLRPKQARARAREMLERVGLGAHVDHRPAELSGGEQQRVTIARALAPKPAIVWADEPTGALDSKTATTVLDLIAELNREDGQTVILVTHDPFIGESASRLVQMQDGRIKSDRRRAGLGTLAVGGGTVRSGQAVASQASAAPGH